MADSGKMGADVVPPRPSRTCPICGKPSDPAVYPFCSKRCADVDLNRWLSGVYTIPAREDEDDDGSDTPERGSS